MVEYPEWLANVIPVPKKDSKSDPDGSRGHGEDILHYLVGYLLLPSHAIQVLERIRQFRLKLNPKKCTFGVTSGKLLGYMVSERGIETDLDKIRAILDMPASRTKREVRGFLGILQYISRFIARLTNICEPIFRLMRKSQPTIWDYQYQRAFERIREYLLSPPVLVPPTLGCLLLLYLSVSNVALGCMLAQLNDSGKDQAIYYLSKRMLDYEMRYVMIECYYLALVWTRIFHVRFHLIGETHFLFVKN
ncbi:Transposon Tf2-12 polyprotein [Vitis vinifera]|uniref:Transposon Tf2-12 polyprotein n=1 Tax=Vitis vinifera TaxID=29760 RepID=A0A438FSX7_VITVI|nr:Transposon Tf2-12 polyprotein [Vitis vinifera]